MPFRSTKIMRAESTEDALSRKTEECNDLLRRLECQAQIAAREKELKEVALVDNLRLRQANTELNSTVEAALAQVRDAQAARAKPLRYADLGIGGILEKHVPIFTYFTNFNENEAFLEAINIKGNANDTGVCSRLLRYGAAAKAAREGIEAPGVPGEDGGRPRLLCWKDDYLIWSAYVHCGWTYAQESALFGVSDTYVGDAVHTWTLFLDDMLCKGFPCPTPNQMYRAYPIRVITSLGHARNWVNIDCTELPAETSSMNSIHSAQHSAYKKTETVKWVTAGDGIGCVWGTSIPDGFPGSISDPQITKLSNCVEACPGPVLGLQS